MTHIAELRKEKMMKCNEKRYSRLVEVISFFSLINQAMIRQLLSYIKNYRTLVSLNVIFNILTVLFSTVSIVLLAPFLELLFDIKDPILTKPTFTTSIDSFVQYFNYYLSTLIIENGRKSALVFVCIAIISVFFLKNLFRYLAMAVMAPVRNGIVRDVRARVFSRLIHLPMSYFSEERKGDLISRMTADVQEIQWSILSMIEVIFREPLAILASLGVMLYISPQLTLFVLVLIIFTVLIIGNIGKTLKKTSARAQDSLGKILTILDEALGSLRIIKGFNAEGTQQAKFDQENNHYRRTMNHLLWRKDLSSPLSEFLGICVIVILLWYGAALVFDEAIKAQTFIVFVTMFYNIIGPAKSFSTAYYNIQKGAAAAERVDDILKIKNTITDAPLARPIVDFNKKIEYRQVDFYYHKNEPVLCDINLIIEKGKTIALVGASGGGKSTMVDLLPRFYDPIKGQILIDGIDIRQYRLTDLRGLMGIVTQQAILFNDTIYNNIAFGWENANPEKIEVAARIANAHDFIMATEKGYDTIVGDRGSKLSGGQRQRLTIARAILRNPPILILDEATSSLDSESEKQVQDALQNIMDGRTCLVIAHRLSTIRHADEIIVLQEGRITEHGNHQTLIQQQGIYQNLLELQ